MNRFAILATLFLLVVAPLAGAQVTETSVAFDSAAKVRTLTPALVERFALTAPVWPVSGEFREARLYEVSTGGHVLAVERTARRIERYALTADNVAALRFAIDAAMARTGQTVTEDRADEISQPARGAFVRNQMLLTWTVYGPSLAAMTRDAQAGTAMYLLATGASYFITTGISRKTTVSRAQNHLATDGALRGWGVGAGLSYVLAPENPDGRTVAAIGLAGSLGGAIVGFNRGKRLTDSEAQAATSVSNLFAASALGLSGSVGLLDANDDGRAMVAAIVAAGLAGYGIGPTYPRRARYTVTKGDIQVTEIGAVLGAALAITPFVDDDFDTEAEPFFAVATAGLLAGTFLTESRWARQYDHSAWDAGQTSLGTAAGALMGSAAAVLTEPGVRGTYSLVVGGGLFGALIGHSLAQPARAGAAGAETRVGSRVKFDPSALGLAAAGVQGRHAILSLSF